MKDSRIFSRCSSKGFTLVELLVVIGIIALLISILLPTLGKARHAANTIKCAAGLRSIMQGVQLYAANNKGAIPGSPWTTSRFLFKDITKGTLNGVYSDHNCPTVLNMFDWMLPVATFMNYKFADKYPGSTKEGDDAWRQGRFDEIRNRGVFACVENVALAKPYGTPPLANVGYMPSYCAAWGFLIESKINASTNGPAYGQSSNGVIYANVPSNYRPQISSVGDASRKIFVADSAKFVTETNLPDVNFSFSGTATASPFVDDGAYTKFSVAWCRSQAPGNTPAATGQGSDPPFDPRIFAYRHGSSKPNVRGDGGFKTNCGFFDGHVELMGDLESANPSFWFPKGSTLEIDGVECQPDVLAKYFNNKPNPAFIVPF